MKVESSWNLKLTYKNMPEKFTPEDMSENIPENNENIDSVENQESLEEYKARIQEVIEYLNFQETPRMLELRDQMTKEGKSSFKNLFNEWDAQGIDMIENIQDKKTQRKFLVGSMITKALIYFEVERFDSANKELDDAFEFANNINNVDNPEFAEITERIRAL